MRSPHTSPQQRIGLGNNDRMLVYTLEFVLKRVDFQLIIMLNFLGMFLDRYIDRFLAWSNFNELASYSFYAA